jgi:hypothetical protein
MEYLPQKQFSEWDSRFMLFIIIHAAEMKQSLPLAKVDPAKHT